MLRLIMLLLVPLVLFIAIACGDRDGDEDATPTSTVAPAETPTPAANDETSGAGGFRQFVATFQEALDEDDVSFLPDRALTEAVVCTAEDLQGGNLGGPPCEFEGEEFDGFLVGHWLSEGGIIRVEDAFLSYDTMLATDLPAETDDFGDGSVQIYALDIGEDSFDAIVAAIIERPLGGGGGPLRVSYRTTWAFERGRWMVTSTLVAFAQGEDFLVPFDEGRHNYANWERYEGS